MADLSDLQSAQTVKIVGADSAGIETNAAVVKNPSTPATAADPRLLFAALPYLPSSPFLPAKSPTGRPATSTRGYATVRPAPIGQSWNAHKGLCYRTSGAHSLV